MSEKVITFNTVNPGIFRTKSQQKEQSSLPKITCNNPPPPSMSFGAKFGVIKGGKKKGDKTPAAFDPTKNVIIGGNLKDRQLPDNTDYQTIVKAKNLQSGNFITAPAVDITGSAVLGTHNNISGEINTGENFTAGDYLSARDIIVKGDAFLRDNSTIRNDMQVSGNLDAEKEGKVVAGNHNSIGSLMAKGDVVVGNNNSIDMVVVAEEFTAGNKLTSETVIARDINVGDNAVMEVVHTNNFTAGNGVEVVGLEVEGDVSVGTIKELEEVLFRPKLQEDEDGYVVYDPLEDGKRIFAFNNEKMPEDKIIITLDPNIAQIQLQPKKVDPNILDKFEFYEFNEDGEDIKIDPKDKNSGHIISVKYGLSQKK